MRDRVYVYVCVLCAFITLCFNQHGLTHMNDLPEIKIWFMDQTKIECFLCTLITRATALEQIRQLVWTNTDSECELKYVPVSHVSTLIVNKHCTKENSQLNKMACSGKRKRNKIFGHAVEVHHTSGLFVGDVSMLLSLPSVHCTEHGLRHRGQCYHWHDSLDRRCAYLPWLKQITSYHLWEPSTSFD